MTHICNLGFANHTSSIYSVKSPCDTITPRRFCNTVCSILFIFTVVVFPEWIEHLTSILSGLRSNQLSYGNIKRCLSSSHRFIRNVLVPWHKRGILSYHAFTIFFTNTSYNSRNSKTTYRVVRPVGLEPTIGIIHPGLKVRCYTNLATSANESTNTRPRAWRLLFYLVSVSQVH